MRYATLSAVFFSILAHPSLGQGFGYLDANGVRARFLSSGLIAGGNGQGFEVPQGQGTHSLYSAGLWLAGLDTAGVLRTAVTYYNAAGQRDYFPGPLTTDGTASITQDISNAFDRVWVVTREEVDRHLEYHQCMADPLCDVDVLFPDGYTTPSSIAEWPAHGPTGYEFYLAPFFDFNADGSYVPEDGDAPCIMGDQQMFFVFNDKLLPHTESVSSPFGVEVQAMPFAFAGNDPALEQTIFMRYRIINRGSDMFEHVYVGMFNDADLGCANDDFIGSDPQRNLQYVYNWSDVDLGCLGAAGYGQDPPAFGMTIIKGPAVDHNDVDDTAATSLPAWNGTGFGDGIIDNERHGLSSSVYFNREGLPAMTDPASAQHFYNYLRAMWKDDTPLTHGGDGYSTDPEAVAYAYMFPGNSDPEGVGGGGTPLPAWSETVPTPATPDRRGVMGMGPFTLYPCGTVDLVMAYVFARAQGGGAQASVEALKQRVDSVRAFASTLPIWDMPDDQALGFQCANYSITSIAERGQRMDLSLFPSPTRDAVHFDAPAALLGARLVVRDVSGRIVLQQRVSTGMNRIDLGHASPGLYFCEVITDTLRGVGPVVKE